MSWFERLREAAYTSPSGARVVFQYEDVSREVDKKTTGFLFPDANGTYVQDLGHSGRRYPLRVFFWGNDYDLVVAAFEAALLESGTGKLDHPLYGPVDVVPFGTIKRRDDLKTGANQAIVEVAFWETIGLIYPAAQADPASAVLGGVSDYNAALSGAFDDATSLGTAVERATLKSRYQSLLDSAQAGLQTIADVQDNVRTRFQTVVDSVNQGIDILIAEPLTLAFQTVELLQAPARARASIEARLEAYGDLATSIIAGSDAVASPGVDARSSNDFYTRDLFASTAVTGSVLSVVNHQFSTKPEAIAAADTLLTQFEAVSVWREANFDALNEIDTGAAYQQLQTVVAVAAAFLVQISFSLQQERRVVLTRNRTIIDLAAELYGRIDEQLDFLISSNNLSGSEILELPRGREIVYYV